MDYVASGRSKGKSPGLVDLHGLHVKEALSILEEQVEAVRRLKPKTSRAAPHRLSVLIGTGHHTKVSTQSSFTELQRKNDKHAAVQISLSCLIRSVIMPATSGQRMVKLSKCANYLFLSFWHPTAQVVCATHKMSVHGAFLFCRVCELLQDCPLPLKSGSRPPKYPSLLQSLAFWSCLSDAETLADPRRLSEFCMLAEERNMGLQIIDSSLQWQIAPVQMDLKRPEV